MFKPDYKNIADAAKNKESARTPLYEHNISDKIMERLTGKKFAHLLECDTDKYFEEYCDFFRAFGYDTVTYEACITDILPYGGALAHPQAGYIDGIEKFQCYPFDEVKQKFIDYFVEKFESLRKAMPDGMKAIGGAGNGIFEIAQDLCGYETLCILSYDEPELFADIFVKVGDMMYGIWKWLLDNYKDVYCVARFGDDLGYKSNTLLPHAAIKEHIIPQYKRLIELVHSYDLPFLLHSCGYIFDVMEDIIDVAGIDAKHSNEDQISDFKVWVDRYGDRIGNFGGIDTDCLVRMKDSELIKKVTEVYDYCHKGHGGFALGSGNSIPEYVNPDKYKLMINTVRMLRGDE